MVRWRPEEITFKLEDALTDGRVVTFTVFAPGCTLQVMVTEEGDLNGRRIVLTGAHIQGAAPNEIGAANLRMIGDTFCE